MGYAGGTTKNPTYHNLGDHTETIQVDYDPTGISYKKLLNVFWQSHSPGRRPWSNQYKPVVFYHNEEQKRLATESRNRIKAKTEARIYTEIRTFSGFYLAEAYHQKYRLQSDRYLMKEFRAMYPDMADLVNSTAAARTNGYISGHGTFSQLQEELSGLGLSPQGEQRLLNIVR